MQTDSTTPDLTLPIDNPNSLYARRRLSVKHPTDPVTKPRRRSWKERCCCWCAPCNSKTLPPSSDAHEKEKAPLVHQFSERKKSPSTAPSDDKQTAEPWSPKDFADVVLKLQESEDKYGHREKYHSMFSDAPLYQLCAQIWEKHEFPPIPEAEGHTDKPIPKVISPDGINHPTSLHVGNEHHFEAIDKDSPVKNSTSPPGSQSLSLRDSSTIASPSHSDSISRGHIPTVSDYRNRGLPGPEKLKTSPLGPKEMHSFIAEVAGSGPNRMCWSNMPQVVNTRLAVNMDSTQKKLQEALFEVITSEASYYRSINVLIDTFYNAESFQPGSATAVVNHQQKHHLFSNILEIQFTSERFLIDMEACFRKNPMLTDLCDVVYKHSEYHFEPYVTYTQNQMYQTRTLQQLCTSSNFKEAVSFIQSQPACSFLDMNSFLLMPMQRVTRLRLLVSTLLRYAPKNTKVYRSGLAALASLENFISKCDHKKSVMEQKERLVDLFSRLEYRLNAKSVGSENRVLVKEGILRLENVSRPIESVFQQRFRSIRRSREVNATLFLFDDLLLVVKRRSNKRMMVEDSAALSQLRVTVEKTPPNFKINIHLPMTFNGNPDRSSSAPEKEKDRRLSTPNRRKTSFLITPNEELEQLPFSFNLTIDDSENNCSLYTFLCKTLSERERWVDALSPTHYGIPDKYLSRITDCPQLLVRRSYSAQEADELELKEGDQVSLLVSLSDGWCKGILPDGRRGWFPENIGIEIVDPNQKRDNSENFILMEEARAAYAIRKRQEQYDEFPRVGSVRRT